MYIGRVNYHCQQNILPSDIVTFDRGIKSIVSFCSELNIVYCLCLLVSKIAIYDVVIF